MKGIGRNSSFSTLRSTSKKINLLVVERMANIFFRENTPGVVAKHHEVTT